MKKHTPAIVAAASAVFLVGAAVLSTTPHASPQPPTVSPSAGAVASIQLPASAIAKIRALTSDATLSPCVSEDSDNCFWDATVRGNGFGNSFIVIAGHYYYAGGK